VEFQPKKFLAIKTVKTSKAEELNLLDLRYLRKPLNAIPE
jgi:hypothetical protein